MTGSTRTVGAAAASGELAPRFARTCSGGPGRFFGVKADSSVYISGGAIPSEYENDARHIAIATVNDIRVIVSWNFRHMVNIDRKQKINSVNLREGLPLVDFVSPWEISYEEA